MFRAETHKDRKLIDSCLGLGGREGGSSVVIAKEYGLFFFETCSKTVDGDNGIAL